MGPQPWPGQAGGISCHTGTAIRPCPAIPHPCCPWECTEPEPSSCCLLLLPCFAAHVKPNMFSKAFQFLMKTSCVYTLLGLGTSVFWSPPLFVLSWDRWWPRVPVSPDEAGMLFGAGRGTAAGSQHIPIPGSTSRCQLCQPTLQHGTRLGGIPASHGCSSVAAWEGDTWKPQQAEPRGKTNSP